jgi:hypothetical protein
MGLFDTIGNLLGIGGQGSGFQAQGITPQQLNTSIGQATSAYGQQQDLANALAAQGQQGMGSQSALTQALMQQMQGQGPNPAAAQLANTTGQNIAAQGALMAGQRGAAGNIGLAARQAGQQGAGIQQQAVGQNAVLQAQQQLAAQNQLQNLAASQLGQQAGAVGGLNQYALQNQGQMMNMMGGQNQANQAMAAGNAQRTAGVLGGLANAAGSALAGPIGSLFKTTQPTSSGQGAGGGMVPTMYSGGEVPDHFNSIHSIYHGGNYEGGGVVPGIPKVNYNSPKNDVVDAKLTPKEIVLPLSVTESDNPAEEAKKFVAAIMAKKGNSKMEESEFKSALKDAIKSRKK